MTTTINVKTPAELKRAYQRIAKGIQAPFKSTRRLFIQLGTLIDRDTILTFKNEGAYQDRIKWPGFSPDTLKTKLGTPKIRYGTDKKPKRTAAQLARYKSEKGLWYRRGIMPGYEGERRYAENSKLLQASGSFRNSFRILKVGAEKMRYGTLYPDGEYIMRRRPAIQYTNQDKSKYTKTILGWWFGKMKI